MDGQFEWVYARLYGPDQSFWRTYSAARSLRQPRIEPLPISESETPLLASTKRATAGAVIESALHRLIDDQVDVELASMRKLLESGPEIWASAIETTIRMHLLDRVSRLAQTPLAAIHRKWIYQSQAMTTHRSVDVAEFERFLAGEKSVAVLRAILTDAIRNAADGIGEFLTRVFAEYPRLAREFALPTGALGFRSSGADTHNRGRVTLVVQIDGKDRLVYKPTSGSSALAWNTVVSWANARLTQQRLMAPKIVDMGTHHWAEFIEWVPAQDDSELHQFYENAGAIAAFAYFVGLEDLHFENVVAHKTCLVVVDTEALLAGERNPTNVPPPSHFHIFDSALRTGLFPTGGSDEHPLDIAGLSTDAVGTPAAAQGILRHLPTLDVAHRLDHFSQDVLNGFELGYHLVQNNAADFEPVLRGMSEVVVRIVARPTPDYAKLLSQSLQPIYLQDSCRWTAAITAKLLEAPAQHAELRQATAIAAQELGALASLDVPYFQTRAASLTLETCDGVVDAAFLSRSGVACGCARIAKAGNLDLSHQLACLKASLCPAGRLNSFTVLSGRRKSLLFDYQDSSDGLSEARHVADQLWAARVPSALGGVQWLSWTPVLHKSVPQLGPVGYGLYHGSVGIAIFFSALLAACGERDDRVRLDLILHDLELLLRDETQERFLDSLGLSLASGASGLVYGLSTMAGLGVQFAFREVIASFVERVCIRAIEQPPQSADLIDGKAGIMLGLNAARAQFPSPRIDDALQSLRDGLFRQFGRDRWGRLGWIDVQMGTVLGGVAHGTSGIVFAIIASLRSPLVADEVNFLNQALEEENRQYHAGTGDWADLRPGFAGGGSPMRAWCTGSTGIQLVRRATQSLLSASRGPHLASLWHGLTGPLMNATQWYSGAPDHLCCGNLGRAVLRMGLREKNFDKEGGDSERHWNVSAPGLFQGVAGIGYYLLRTCRANTIPNIALFE